MSATWLYTDNPRFPWAIAQGPGDDYVAAPIYAFNPLYARQVDETYPPLKQHVVIATGTKTECSRGVRLIQREERSSRKQVPLDRAMQILEESQNTPQARDWSKCHRCFGSGSVYVDRMKLRCPLCGGSGQGMR
jgi:hypothetical protein